jgi:hypothetical protein
VAYHTTPDNPANEVILDAASLAQQLTSPAGNGPSPRTLERWRTQGFGPPFIKVGHRVVYRQRDVDRWLDEQTRRHTHDPGTPPPASRRRTR